MNGEINEFLSRYTKSGDPVSGTHRFERLMKKLGDPQDSLKYVHIAGTNGKGSVVRMISESLTRAGYKTGEFTSPYVYSFNDRIKIDGGEIPDEELSRLINILKPVLADDNTGYSQFEITNAMAFIYYARQKCDIVVLETGLGGLYDSTNIIRSNICAVITSISYDHTQVLGDTIEKIAYQKAGIIKENRPVIIYPDSPPEAMGVIEKFAAKKNSELVLPSKRDIRDHRSDISGCSFVYKNREYTTAMPGTHQIYNAVTAIEAMNIIRREYPKLTENIAAQGIAAAALPSRCQIIRKSSPMVIVDGAHNPDGMKALGDLVKDIGCSPKIMICGMAADKDREKAIAFIAPYIDKALCVEDFAPKTARASEIAGGFSDSECVSLDEAFDRAVCLAGKDGLVIIGGSLYLPGALKKYMGLLKL